MSTRRLAEERGGILVMSAVMIPVFLLLTALVVDVGNWFTHKRQLQNRADAAAFAAGVEYATNWKACVQNGDATLKLNTAQAIADAARQYAADPEAADYTGGALPTLHNPEIANQANVDVVINSSNPDYNDDTDHSDLGGSVASPCLLHAADDISAAGHWTDVRVKERDLPSIFGAVGLPLSRTGARARVEIRPAISGHRFLPLAVPNNIITKVQVRYYKECGSGAPSLIATRDLAALPSDDQSGFAADGGGTLWGLPVDPTNLSLGGDKNLSFDLPLPAYDVACGDYVPVGVEVRLASRDDVDLNQSCAALIAARYADCFHRLSQIRVWNDGNADSQPRVPRVIIRGGCGAPGDGYFSTLPVAATNCKVDVEVQVDWGTRSLGETNVPGNFKVSANGTNVPLASWSPGGVSTYATASGAVTVNPGANPVTISLSWLDDANPPNHWDGNECTNPPGPADNPCQYSGTDGHRTFVGTTGNAGAVALVRSGGPWNVAANRPGEPFDNHRSGGGPLDCNNSDTCRIWPTVGTRTVLKTGVYTTLRLDDPQANQTLRCDPDVAQGQEFTSFDTGCKPWYAANDWASPWWIGPAGAKHCPADGDWFSTSDLGAGFGLNNANNAWQCVLTAPGMTTGQVGDNMAVATDNCDTVQTNSCQVTSFDCNYDGNYDGKPSSTDPGWKTNGGKFGAIPPNPAKLGSAYPRVVNLFIVPYQASKGLTGAGDEIPIIGFASFYVMDWTGANNQQDDPCPDTTWGSVNLPHPPKGAITGVFIETVKYEPGPVDKNATCVEGQLTPCRVTLVR